MTKNKLRSFLLKFSFVRFIRSFFYNRFSVYIKYCCYFLLLAFFIFTIYLFFYKKITFGQIKNIIVNKSVSLISSNYNSYNKVTIKGNKYTKYEDLEIIVRGVIKNSGNKSSIDEYISVISELKTKIIELPWVEEVVITRSLPGSLNINIKEYSPFAIWMDNKGNKFVINKDGKIIKTDDIEQFYYLLILTGNDANLNAKSLFNILVAAPQISKDIYSATWIGGRRWDIRFINGLLVKLPETNIKEAWNRLIRIYSMPGSLINLNAIDLRIDKKIYLEYNDQVIKELKSL